MAERILIVEDEEDINKLLVKILQTAGYRTMQVFSGTEACLLAKLEQPDLILLDLMLPGMTGRRSIAASAERK